jgi:hypothetical protein
MEGEAWVGGSEGFGYTYRDRGVDSPVTHRMSVISLLLGNNHESREAVSE